MTNNKEENIQSNSFELNITKRLTIEDLVTKIINDIDNDNEIINTLLINFPREDTALIMASSDGLSKLLKVKSENQANIMKLIDMFLRNNKNLVNEKEDDSFDGYVDSKSREKILNG